MFGPIQVLPPGTTLWRRANKQLIYTIDEVDMSMGEPWYRLSEDDIVVNTQWISNSGLDIMLPQQQATASAG